MSIISIVQSFRESVVPIINELYEGRATILVYADTVASTGETVSDWVTIAEDIPCRLSFASSPAASSRQTADSISQGIKMLYNTDVDIKAGSRIIITQNGITTLYENAGDSKHYATHKEVELTKVEVHP